MMVKILALFFILFFIVHSHLEDKRAIGSSLSHTHQTNENDVKAAGTTNTVINTHLPEDVVAKYVTKKRQETIALQSEMPEFYRSELQLRGFWLNALLLFCAIILVAALVIYGFFKKARREKQILERLKKGVHHDVKNQYQEIMAFLRLAKKQDDQFSLEEACARINSMAKVHHLLYTSPAAAGLPMQAYLENICNETRNFFGLWDIEIHISALVTPPAHVVGKIGLIVNELMVNVFKYAFEPTQKGIVDITFKKMEQKYVFRLADNGKGINENNIKRFGSTLIEGWADELGGKFEIKNNNGTQFEMTF